MKKVKKLMILFTCATLSATPVTAESIPTAAESTATTETPAPTVTPKPAKVKRGWVILKNGKKRYYRNGKRLLGFQKIGKNYFYFNKNGIMQVNKTIPNGTKGYTYYTNRKGHVYAKTKGSKYFNANGSRMSDKQLAEFLSKQIAARITTPGMSKEQKLQTCFNWVIKKYYYIWRRFDQGGQDWPAVFANDHFLYGKGDCLSDAGAFAYLAKAIGYKNVYVCADARQSNNNAHSWAEINGLVYDPLFAEAKSYSKYYGCTYGSYGLYAVTRYKLS